jgi:hypothetical protein
VVAIAEEVDEDLAIDIAEADEDLAIDIAEEADEDMSIDIDEAASATGSAARTTGSVEKNIFEA